MVWPLLALENVIAQVSLFVKETLNAFPVDQSTVRAVVHAVSELLAIVVWATAAVPEISVNAGCVEDGTPEVEMEFIHW